MEENGNKAILFDFYTDWCGTCQSMEPVIDKLNTELQNIEVIRINVDEHPEFKVLFKIKNVPTFVLLEEEKELWRHVGLITKREIVKSIFNQIKNKP